MIFSHVSTQRFPCARVLSATVLVGTLCLAAPIVSLTASAQGDSASTGELGPHNIEPTRYEKIGWHKVIFLNFDSEKSRRAKALTEQCLASAGATTGADVPLVVETSKGPWDLLMIYSLDEAPLEKRWETPADLGALRTACTRAAGQDTWQEYKDLMDRSSALVGFSGRLGRRPGGS